MDVFSRKAKFVDVAQNPDAMAFHANRYENGSRDNLAKLCWQARMQSAKTS